MLPIVQGFFAPWKISTSIHVISRGCGACRRHRYNSVHPMFPPQLALALALCRAQEAQSPVHQDVVDGELIIEWRVKELDLERSIARFRNGVKATYGVTVLYADSLEVNYREKSGIAHGQVRIEDPEGGMRARDLQFNWANKTAVGRDIEVSVPLVYLTAREARIFPEKWVLRDVRMATGSGRLLLEGEAHVLTLYPGRHGTATRPAFWLNRTRLFRLPDQSFSLDRRVTGLRWPEISTMSGSKLGVKWSGSFLVNDHVGISTYTQLAPGRLPGYGLALAYSATPTDATRGPIMPRSDFDEWYRDSYLENVTVPDPGSEIERLRELRKIIGIGSSWALRVSERQAEAANASKPVEIVGEIGGRVGSVGALLTGRAQQLKPGPSQSVVNRAVVQGSAVFPLFEPDPRLRFGLRLDSNLYASRDGTFGWVRGQLGLAAMPAPWVRLGLGYVHGTEFGTPHFDFDRLFTDRALNFRTDFLLPSFNLSLLVRYDLRSRRIFDREVRIMVPIGLFEPYVVYRELPRGFYAGIQFRLDSVVGRLQQRRPTREPSIATRNRISTGVWDESPF